MNYITINASVATPSTEEMAYAQTNNRLDTLNNKLDTSVQQLQGNIAQPWDVLWGNGVQGSGGKPSIQN